jgi:diaminopropionate ammonia-lyase
MMEPSAIEKVRRFHASFPEYAQTPLVSLDNLAGELNVGGIYLKDESPRFGLNSFKGLGASYALAAFIAKTVGMPVEELDYAAMTSPEIRERLGDFTFIATTDGNHGRGVAWAAEKIGQKAIIYMPKGCPPVKLDNIKRLGAEGYITELNYDDTIRFTAELAAKTPKGVIVQDQAWEGYTDIPGWIMQGYGVVALEACKQLSERGIKPTHLLVQAGVGAFAGASTGVVANFYGKDHPTTIVVESEAADCHYRSAIRGDGEIVNVGGDMNTIMAGLACGEPNPITWEILRDKASFFACIKDPHAARAMRILGAPVKGDGRVVSGESGASAMGCLLEMITGGSLKGLREAAGIGPDSRILLVSTEGDTDPGNYRRIVWEGAYPSI